MPPRFNVLPQVREQGLPDARMAPIPQGTYDTRQAQANLGAIQEAQQQISFYDAMGAMTQLKKRELDSRYQEVLGENARELPKQMREEYQKWTSELADTLTDPRARAMFQRKADENEISFIGNVEQHALRQKTVAEAQKTDAFVSTWQDAGAKAAASDDAAGAANAADQIKQAWTLHGHNNGIPQVAVDDAIKKSTSQMYASGIVTMLNNQRDQAANDYFGKVKDKLTEQDINRLLPKLNEGSSLGTAQRIGDRVFTNYVDWETKAEHKAPETYAQAIAEARELSAKLDPKTKALVEQQIAHRWQEKTFIEKDATDKTFQAASHTLDQNPGKLAYEVIDRETWDSLPQVDRERLIDYSAKLMKPVKEGDDFIGVTKWHSLSNDDIAKMSPADMLRWRYGDPKDGIPPLTREHYDTFSAQWGKIRKGEDDLTLRVTKEDREYLFGNAKNKGLMGLSNNDTLEKIADKGSRDKSRAFEAAWEQIKKRMDAAQGEKGKRLGQLEREEIINKWLLEQPEPKGWLMRILSPSKESAAVAESITRNTSIPEAPGYRPYTPEELKAQLDAGKVQLGDTEKARINDSIKRVTGKDGSDELIRRVKAAQAAGASPEEVRALISGQ